MRYRPLGLKKDHSVGIDQHYGMEQYLKGVSTVKSVQTSYFMKCVELGVRFVDDVSMSTMIAEIGTLLQRKKWTLTERVKGNPIVWVWKDGGIRTPRKITFRGFSGGDLRVYFE